MFILAYIKSISSEIGLTGKKYLFFFFFSWSGRQIALIDPFQEIFIFFIIV